MNELTKTNINLPDTIEDLSKFVLVNEERVQALRAQIRAIKKVNLAKDVYEQKLTEAQEVGEIVVEAGRKMGELLLTIQKHQGNSSRANDEFKTKREITSEMGISKDQVSQYQQMAQNPEAVQKAIEKAIENGDVVSRSQVMKEIRALKEELRKAKEQKPEIKEVIREVVPSDYKEAKNKAKAYDAETKRLNQKLTEAYNKRNELEEEIRSLQEQTVREQANNDFIAGAIYFIAQCGSFIRDVGGYVWIADKLADLPERDRVGYIKAAMAVRDWAVVLLNNIERSEYGKQEIERISSESN